MIEKRPTQKLEFREEDESVCRRVGHREEWMCRVITLHKRAELTLYMEQIRTITRARLNVCHMKAIMAFITVAVQATETLVMKAIIEGLRRVSQQKIAMWRRLELMPLHLITRIVYVCGCICSAVKAFRSLELQLILSPYSEQVPILFTYWVDAYRTTCLLTQKLRHILAPAATYVNTFGQSF